MEKLKTPSFLTITTFITLIHYMLKKLKKSRGKAHWFAHSILDGKLSYPSYVVLDENLSETNGLQRI